MTRKQRWIRLIDGNLDYLFGHQGPDGRFLEEAVPSRSTVQAAHAAVWAFAQPGSRHFQGEEALARARQAVDLLVRQPEGWKGCPFTPSYFGETLLLLEGIDGKEHGSCREVLRAALSHQRQTGNHTFGHFSDWDILYALALAVGGRIFGDQGMKEAAAEHARLVWPNVVPGGDGFYYLISPYQYWPPSVNYTGISAATFARYYEVSGDDQALEMVRAVKDYFLYFVEPWGLTEFTTSPWHKHPTDTKEDTFAFVAAAAEFLAGDTRDRRLDQVAELMLENLESMAKPAGDFQRRLWECAWINETPYDPNTTAYLCQAADWCREGEPEPLPDAYLSERQGINGFKARFADFGYSVVCGESYVSLTGAWTGRDSLLQEVAVLVADKDGLVCGQLAPLWRKHLTRFPDGFAQTAYYQPAEIIGDSWRARYAEWRVYQTYVGTVEELVGIISLESLADQEGRFVAVDLHLGPAGQKVYFGSQEIEGKALVAADNPEPVRLASLAGDSWVQYGHLGIFFREVSGKDMTLTCWDAVAREGTLHASEFSSMISNDLVLSCATPETLQRFEKGARYQAIFIAAPVRDARHALSLSRAGRYLVLPTGVEHTSALAIDQGRRILIAVVTHQPWVRPVFLRYPVPQGTYKVTVYAEERQLPLKEFSFCGQELRAEIATVSPAVVVEMVRE